MLYEDAQTTRALYDSVFTYFKYHWNTKVYSKHIATDGIHKKLSKLSDSYVEKSFGQNGRIPVHISNFI